MSNFWQWLRGGTPSHVERSFQHTWPLPAWLTVVLALAAVSIVFYCYRRASDNSTSPVVKWLPWLRVAALAGLVWMMVGGSWQRYETELPDLLLIIDDSVSMSHVDSPSADGGQSRFERIQTLLLENDAQRLAELQSRYHVRLFFLADELRDAGATEGAEALKSAAIDQRSARHHATRLGDGLADLLLRQRSRPTAAIVVVTDGVVTVGQSLKSVGEDAKRRGIPLWFFGVGDRQIQQDLALTGLVHQTTVFPGDLVRIDAKLSMQGEAALQDSVQVRLKQGDQVVDEIDVALPKRESGQEASVPIRFSYRAEEAGEYSLSIQADPILGEVNRANNHLETRIVVRDETIRVLMVQDHPSFDFQLLKNLLGQGLRRDQQQAAFALTTVLQDSDPEYSQQDADASRVFPATQEELMGYDVVILGDADAQDLSRSQLEGIAAFVAERGGALIVLSGPDHTPKVWQSTPIEPLLPVDLAAMEIPQREAILDQPVRPRLTLLGAESPHLQLTDAVADNAVAWARMPPLYWTVRAPAKPGVRVLLAHADAASTPIVCSRFFGAGMVLFHATDESFRWSSHPDGKQFYGRYWLQTLRYMCRSKLGDSDGIELTTDADRYLRGAPVSFRLRFINERAAPADDQGALIVLESDGRRRQTRLQRLGGRRGYFTGQVANLPEGNYRVWMAAPSVDGELPSCSFVVAPPQTELTRLTVDFEAMMAAAKASGGEAAMLPQWGATLEDLPSGRQLRVSPLPPEPIWNSNWIAAFVVAMLVSEWLLRRRVGYA